ncbi:helix-turn-helix transcriptional regulator [Azospirillum sp. YIM DDC1]|uniref:Helix-turn-helix transcriptional regulator n=1 Tax=Azospirillum aestuarii TaxID=2802052 RepID=A0ABS1I8V7_9PROT|nr:helix-turn-helix transcriptional regulator [Azospirillum aestuarii]
MGHHRHTLTGIGSEDRRSTGTLSLELGFINLPAAPNSISRRTETHRQEFRFPEGFAVPAFGGTEYHPPMPKLPATRPKRDRDADAATRRRAAVEFRRKLKASGISQAKLAAALGVQPSTVSSWSTGAVMVPSYDIAYLPSCSRSGLWSALPWSGSGRQRDLLDFRMVVRGNVRLLRR